MAERVPAEPAIDCVSDMPLNGYITGLHVVQNVRTKERFVLGGADDGTIAFWELE